MRFAAQEGAAAADHGDRPAANEDVPMPRKNLSLKSKLALSFSAVSLLFLIAVAVGFKSIPSVGSDVQRDYVKAVDANEASAYAYNMRVSQAQDALAGKFI